MTTVIIYLDADGWTASAKVGKVTFTACDHDTQDQAVGALERLTGTRFNERRRVPAPVLGESVLGQGARQGRLL